MVTADLRGSVADMIIDVTNAMNRGVSGQLKELSRVLQSGTFDNRLAVVHSKVAREAAIAVRKSYGQSGIRHRKGPSGYRPGDRYSGGVMRNALRQEGLVTSNAQGIDFVHTELLNSKAKQWARLNFGAGKRGRESSRRSFPIKFGALVIGSLGLTEEARPDYFIPKGLWTEAGAFYPHSQSPPGFQGRLGPNTEQFRRQDRKLTQGNAALNFFDAGVNVIARRTPVLYVEMLDRIFRDGLSQVKTRHVTVRTSTHRYVLR